MTWFLILDYVLCPVASFPLILVLIILYRRKQVSRNRNQIFVLIGLCHTESAFAIFSILSMFQLLSPRLVIILDISFNTLLFFYDISDIRSFSGFLLEYEIPIILHTKKVVEDNLFSGRLSNDTCFNFGLSNSV